jgi:predicted TPR repeat methyltransferase
MSSTPRSYFDAMYANDPDPWRFENSEYEQRKYALTMACLPRRRYRAAFEPGCSIGVLSSLLAPRCDHLLATDIIPEVVARASSRLSDEPNVRVEARAIPEDWPPGQFDLIVLSEIAYYFDQAVLCDILSRVVASTGVGAHVVGVHWRGTTDYPLEADAVHDVISSTPGFRRHIHHDEPEFLLDVWERTPLAERV